MDERHPKPEPAAPEAYVNSEVIAKFLGVTPAFVDKLALLGSLPALALPPANGEGKRTTWRFRLSAVAEWAQRREHKGRTK